MVENQRNNYIEITGKWTQNVWGEEHKYLVLKEPNIEKIFSMEKLPFILPDNKKYIESIEASDDPELKLRVHWALTYLNHPKPKVVLDTLKAKIPYKILAVEVELAYLLVHNDDDVVFQAATVILENGVSSLRTVFNVIGNKGIISSGITPDQGKNACKSLLSACPDEFKNNLFTQISKTFGTDILKEIKEDKKGSDQRKLQISYYPKDSSFYDVALIKVVLVCYGLTAGRYCFQDSYMMKLLKQLRPDFSSYLETSGLNNLVSGFTDLDKFKLEVLEVPSESRAQIVISNRFKYLPGDTTAIVLPSVSITLPSASIVASSTIFGPQHSNASIQFSIGFYTTTPKDKEPAIIIAKKTSTNIRVVDHGTPSGKKCFIATACYGSYDSQEVVLLRQFRDKYLLKNSLGISFVKIYYTVSPPIANYIHRSNILRFLIKKLILTPIIKLISANNTKQ